MTALSTAETFALAQAQGYAPQTPLQQRPARPVAGTGAPIDLVVLLP